MNSGSDNITPKQLVTFVISAQIGIGILTLPSKLADKVGHDGWISVALSGIICSCLITVICLLLKRYENKSIIQINRILYGKYLGALFSLFLILYMVFTNCYLFRMLISVIQQTALYQTPALLISVLIALPTLYLSSFGLKYICRYSVLIYFVIAVTLFQFFLIINKTRFSFLLPLGAAGVNKIADSLNVSVISLIGFELVAVIYPYITEKKMVLKRVEKANLITCLFYITVILFTTSVFGEGFLKRLVYPLFSLSRTYRAPIFERLDLFYIALWFPAMAGSARLYYYSTQLALRDFFKLKPKKIYLFVQTTLVIILSRIPKNFMDMERYSKYLSFMAIYILAFMVFSYLFSLISKRGVENET